MDPTTPAAAPAATTTPAPASASAAEASSRAPSALESALASDPKGEATKTEPPKAEPTKAEPAKTEPKAETKVALELKLPDGYDVDAKSLDDFKATASELGLDNAKAQRVFDHFLSLEKARLAADDAKFAAQDAAWAKEIQTHPDFGGERIKDSLQAARRGIEHVGGKPIARLFEAAGLGNNPQLFGALVKIGRSLAEDSVAGTSSPAGTKKPRSDAELFYGPAHTTTAKEQ